MTARSLGRIALVFVAVLAAMFTSFTVALLSFGGEWRPIEAEVQSTRIESTRLGTLEWSLFVDFDYEVDGTRHEGRDLIVFHDRDLAATEAAQADWPAGRRFTLYIDPENAKATSLAADGGGQAVASAAALLTPLAIAFAYFGTILFRRRRAAGSDPAGS